MTPVMLGGVPPPVSDRTPPPMPALVPEWGSGAALLPEAPAASVACLLRRNILVEMALQQEVSTRISRSEDLFELTVTEPVMVGDRVAIPANAKAVGQVVDAQGGGVFGAPAKLYLAIRYAEAEGVRIPMRLFHASHGTDKTSAATGLAVVPVVGIFAAFMKGGEICLPAGTKLIAKVAKNTLLPPSIPKRSTPSSVAPVKGIAP